MSPIPKKSVIVAIPVLLIGGTEMQTLNLVEVLADNGYRVTVCCYYVHDVAMVAQFEERGAKVWLMQLKKAEGLMHLAKSLITYFRKMKPDIVHVQYIAPGLVPVIAARLAGIRTVFATVHQTATPYGKNAKLMFKIAARLCTAFFCVSKSVEQSWFGNSQLFNPDEIDLKQRHCTIYNAVDNDMISAFVRQTDTTALRNTLGIGNRRVIGFVGRLHKEKGLGILIDALPHILDKQPDSILMVVGDGPDRAGLELKAASLKLVRHIIWLGQKRPEDVYRLYHIMDVIAVPSLFEGFGLTVAEAMAAGVPTVGSNVGGLAEVIEDGLTGVLVPRGNSEALASALIELLSDQDRAMEMGQKGQARVQEYFSMEKFNRSLLAAYEAFGA